MSDEDKSKRVYIFPDENENDVEWIEVSRGKPDRRKPEWMFRTDEEYQEYLRNYKKENEDEQ